MEKAFVYPTFGDRTSPKEWAENGKPELLEKAIARKKEILAQVPKAAFDPETDQAIRARFNIHL